MKLQLHLKQKQTEYFQQYEVLGLLVKNAFGSEEKPSSSDIIDQKIKSLPKMNSLGDVQAFFKRQNNG